MTKVLLDIHRPYVCAAKDSKNTMMPDIQIGIRYNTVIRVPHRITPDARFAFSFFKGVLYMCIRINK